MADIAIPENVDVVAVPFYGEQILTVEIKGETHVILKPVLEAIGVDYWTQVQKLRGRSWATTSQSLVVAGDGKMREMVTCTVQTFLMLLATIEENRVGADVKPKLVLYQREVAKVIEEYWTKGKAINPRVPKQMSYAELALVQSQALVEHERAIVEIRGDVSALNARMDGIEQKTGWVAALGFAKLRGLPTDNPSTARLGKEAARICRARNIKPGKVDNAVFGEVGLYPVDVLEEAAGILYGVLR